jgi:mutator protein MutT
MRHEVAAALIVRAGRILLGQRSAARLFYPEVWDLFGGHVEPGEPHAQTLVRELLEELGITPTASTFLETLTVDVSSQEQMIVHLYLVTAWDGTPLNRQLEEHSAIGWFSLEEISQLALADDSYPEIFRRYLSLE